MKISAYLECTDLGVFLESVEKADECGYARAWITDAQLLREDTFVYMAHGLRSTSRIVFGTGVSNPVTRHYTVLAGSHATLAKHHPGRVVLGIGRGDAAVHTAGLKPMTTAKFSEILPRLKPLMAGTALDVDGTRLHLVWADEDVPLMVAATGPRNLRLAGSVADIVQIQVGVHPESVRWAISEIHAGAVEAGREPSEVEVSVLCAMWLANDLAEARDICRWAPSIAANHLATVVKHNPELELPIPLRHIVDVQRSHYDYYGGHTDSSAEHAQWVTDEMVDDFALAGPAERIIEGIERLAEVGAGEVAAGFLNGQSEQMLRIGEQIIPFATKAAT